MSPSVIMSQYFMAVQWVSDIKQIEIYTAEILTTQHSPSEVETAIPKLKQYK
jgi:hypothetical protein